MGLMLWVILESHAADDNFSFFARVISAFIGLMLLLIFENN